MTSIGDRIELTADVTGLSDRTHHAGEQGVVEEIHTSGHYTARMDNGRPSFPHRDETKPA